MNVNEIKAFQGFDEVKLKIIEKGEPREFEKFGKSGRVCNAKGQDDTGIVQITLWNEQIDQVNKDDTVIVKNGYAKEWQGEIQISTGKNGTIEKA